MVRRILLALALCGCDGTSPQPQERLVLVTIDTLRYDRFAGPDAVMPVLAAAATEGLSFERCFAVTPVTQPTHASLLTGRQPWEHGVTRNGQVLDERWQTLAEQLADEGFATAAVVASFPLERRFGFAQGFDVFVDDFSEKRPKKVVQWAGIEPDWKHYYSLSDEIVERAIHVLDDLPQGRQFLWVHFYDPHSPYGDTLHGAKPSFTTKQLGFAALSDAETLAGALKYAKNRYRDDVAAVDRALGRLFRRLALDDIDTHIVITADHGESFGEDGSFGHGDRVTPAQVQVPLVVLSPKVSPGVRDDVGGTIDIHRTLLSLVGLDGNGSRGRDLLAEAPSNPIAVGMRRTYIKQTEEVRADGSVVLLSGLRFFLAKGDQLLAGNAESVEGAVDAPTREAARRAFASFEKALQADMAVDLTDDATREALRELGYVR